MALWVQMSPSPGVAKSSSQNLVMEQIAHSFEPRVLALPLKYDLGQVPSPCRAAISPRVNEGAGLAVLGCLLWVPWALICALLILKSPLSIRGAGGYTLLHPLGLCQLSPQVLLSHRDLPAAT